MVWALGWRIPGLRAGRGAPVLAMEGPYLQVRVEHDNQLCDTARHDSNMRRCDSAFSVRPKFGVSACRL